MKSVISSIVFWFLVAIILSWVIAGVAALTGGL